MCNSVGRGLALDIGCERICSKCGETYLHFGQRMLICKPCKRIYDREYHKNRSPESRAVKAELQRARLVANKRYIFNYLSENPCAICGEDDPVVLEFDHIEPSKKSFTIASKKGVSLSKLKAEIAKCRVLCCNCHRRHTANQFGWYSWLKE